MISENILVRVLVLTLNRSSLCGLQACPEDGPKPAMVSMHFPHNCRPFDWETSTKHQRVPWPRSAQELLLGEQEGAGCWPPGLGTPALVDNFTGVPWLPVTAYLQLCFRGADQARNPVCLGMKAIFLSLFLGDFWHLKASSFLTGGPQLISPFTHVPLTVPCLAL